MKQMKENCIIMSRIFVMLILLLSFSCEEKKTQEKKTSLYSQNFLAPTKPKKEKIEELRNFLRENKTYNQNWAILIDFKIPSYRHRFFIYDFKNNHILERALVTHGEGSVTDTPNRLKFSNVENSYCSSLGKYAIGYSYDGQFGKAYKLLGLDSSNSNAFKRAVVLHKYTCVPNNEQKTPICTSLGCPMVSEDFFLKMEKYIDKSNKKMILYAYY